jgi:hypothetical protein
MQDRISYVPFAFVMLITVLALLRISSSEAFQGTADKRVVRRVKKSVASLYLFQSTGYLEARVSVFVISSSFQLHCR